MAYDIGAKIGLEGERDFRNALKEIDSGLKVLNSEMKLTATQFEGQEDSVQSLTQKHDVLERSYLSQQDKIKLLREQLQKTAEAYGESDKRTSALKVSLNDAEAASIKMERGMKDTAQALERLAQYEKDADRYTDELANSMEKAGASSDKMSEGFNGVKDSGSGLGDVLNQLGGKFGISLPSEMTQSLNGLGSLNMGMLATVGVAAGVVKAIVDIEKKLMDLTKAQAAAADELLTTATITGISTDALQEYAYAAELIDVSIETLTSSQTKLIRSMSSAQQGTKEQVEAFDKLHVSYKNVDGSLRDSEDVFWDVIDALGNMTNDTERDAVAMQLLGKSAQDLNPLIKAGRGAMEEFSKEAHNMGYVLDKDALDKLGKVDDAMQRLNNTTEAAKKQIAVQFAPAMEDAMTKAAKLVGDLGEAFNKSGIAESFGMLLDSFMGIIAPADELSEDTIPRLTNALRPLALLVAAIADTIDLFTAMSKWDFAGIGKALGFGYSYGQGNKIQTLQEQWEQTDINKATEAAGYGQYYANGKLYSNYDEYLRTVFNSSNFNGTFEAWKSLNGYNASGNENWRGGWTWVGENGPEKVYLPQGSQISNAQESRSEGGDTIIYVNIDAKNVKEFNDIVEMAQTERMKSRKR